MVSACPRERKTRHAIQSGHRGGGPTAVVHLCVMVFGDLKITSTSTERRKRRQNLAPVLVIISGNSLVFSRKIITSTGFYRCCAPSASAPVVVKKSVSQLWGCFGRQVPGPPCTPMPHPFCTRCSWWGRA